MKHEALSMELRMIHKIYGHKSNKFMLNFSSHFLDGNFVVCVPLMKTFSIRFMFMFIIHDTQSQAFYGGNNEKIRNFLSKKLPFKFD